MTPVTTALLLVDAQQNMFDAAAAVDDADALLARLRGLLQRARAAGAPVVFLRNRGGPGEPDEPGSPGFALHAELHPVPGEVVLDKTTDDAFASTPLAAVLAARDVSRIVVAGLQSEYCVRATVLGAVRHGLKVTLTADGHSTYPAGGRAGSAIRAEVNTELAWQVAIETADSIAFA